MTAELNDPSEVTVTVSVFDAPDPTERLGALRPRAKSAPDVTVSVNVVL